MVSTLDGGLQRFAAETLRAQLQSRRSNNMHDGAILVVDNRTGEVLAYVGNDGDQSSARYVDGVQALRQAGSTLKPFLYEMAFEQRLLTAAGLIEDSPLDLPVLGGLYRPKNYDNQFHGLVTVRTALAASMNVPAVKVLNLIGVDAFRDRLAALGFRKLQPAEFYGPSLALGSVDVTLWDLVNAYRTLAAGGLASSLRLTFEARPEQPRRIFSAPAAFIVADILSDRESRSLTFGLESALTTRFWSAVKTGTSKDMRDNWCVGFSERYTVGVWAGNFSGAPMWDVSGVTGAAPAWVEIMNWLHRNRSSAAPRPPADLTVQTVMLPSLGQSRSEWFLRGTETTVVQKATSHGAARIVYPAAGTIIALDPDIPSGAQKLFFEAQPDGNLFQWTLDGQTLGPANSLLPWTPVQGKHSIALVDRSGRTVDHASFEVRCSSVTSR
jgi:penicillin-binding protein 1C